MKKILSVIVFVLVLLSSVVPIADVEIQNEAYVSVDAWAVEYVEKANDYKITDSSVSYSYRNAINRSDFCDLVYNLAVNVIKAPIPKANLNFADTSSVNVNVLCDMGIINGKGNGIFAPEDLLTREEAATIVVRLVNKLMPVPVTEMYFVYDDEKDISDWAINSVQVISNMKVMNGTGNNKFSPKQNLSVQEILTVLVRLADVYNSNYKADNGFSDNLNSYMPRDKNYMFSPLSIKMALALAANGASDDTKTEILNAVGINNLDEFNNFSKNLIEKYSQTENLKLNIANSIWLNTDNTNQAFSDEFKNLASEYYRAEAKTVNNSNAVNEINSWVNEKTNGKIPTVADNSDFWASIINAIYFKGVWQNEFNKNATQKDEFTSADGKKSQIDFMNKTSWMKTCVLNGISVIELPYKSSFDNFSKDGTYAGRDNFDIDVSMYLLMSDSPVELEKELNSIISNENIRSTYTRLSVPKFKFEYDTSLNTILQSMGIKNAFSVKDADFSKMFNYGTMFISDAIHKTYISVDEVGTEAAAVTSLMMAGSALPPEPEVVVFNKPFYFVIRDNTSGESLFIGRYAFA